MRLRRLGLGFSFLMLSTLLTYGELYDRVLVNVPYPITVNHTVLQPGEYEIRQHDDMGGGSRVLHFFSDHGMKLETTAMAIPALDNRTPEKTELVLDHFGNDYYLNKIWVQGKDYGYEFPLPPEVRMREKEQKAPATVVAQYTPPPAPAQTHTAVAETENETKTETAQVTPPPPPPAEPEAATPGPDTTEAPAPRQQADQRPAAPAMPSTAANWVGMLLGGALVCGSGFALRRVRA